MQPSPSAEIFPPASTVSVPNFTSAKMPVVVLPSSSNVPVDVTWNAVAVQSYSADAAANVFEELIVTVPFVVASSSPTPPSVIGHAAAPAVSTEKTSVRPPNESNAAKRSANAWMRAVNYWCGCIMYIWPSVRPRRDERQRVGVVRVRGGRRRHRCLQKYPEERVLAGPGNRPQALERRGERADRVRRRRAGRRERCGRRRGRARRGRGVAAAVPSRGAGAHAVAGGAGDEGGGRGDDLVGGRRRG